MRRSVLTSIIRANQQSQLWAVYEADYECDASTCRHESSAVLGTKDQEKRAPFRLARSLGGSHDCQAGGIRFEARQDIRRVFGHHAEMPQITIQFPLSIRGKTSSTRSRPRICLSGQAFAMHMSNNSRTKQLLGVKQARLIMNDPLSSSLSGLNLWLPIPDRRHQQRWLFV